MARKSSLLTHKGMIFKEQRQEGEPGPQRDAKKKRGKIGGVQGKKKEGGVNGYFPGMPVVRN